MSNQIAYTNESLQEKIDWSKAICSGDLLPRQYRNNPANIMFAIEYADALNISRIHVLTSINVISGRPTPSADLMAAMVRTAGHKLRIVSNDDATTATLIRSDDPDFEYTATWDKKKAMTAGLWGNKGPWSQYPGAMLRSRAISEVVRMGASEVMAGGIYTAEELGANVDADGNVIDMPKQATAERVQPQPQQPPVSDVDVDKDGHPPVVDVQAALEAADSVEACRDLWQVCKQAGYVNTMQEVNAKAKLLKEQPVEAEEPAAAPEQSQLDVQETADMLDAEVIDPELVEEPAN